MDIVVTEIHDVKSARHGDLGLAGEIGLTQSGIVESLDIETVASTPHIPTDRKWAVRFDAAGTVTIVLGMKDYGRGWFSAYFASLLATRLGIPFRQIRVYYSATLPAVLQTPVPSPIEFRRSQMGPAVCAVADVVHALCDQVMEKARSAFAAMAGVDTLDVGFDQATRRFFVMDRERSRTILEIAEASRSTKRSGLSA